MTEGRIPARVKLLAALCALMFAALTTRLWFMQVLASEQYRQEARQNGIRLVYEPAARGRILDREGNLLVGNRISKVVTVNRQKLGHANEEEVLFRLSKLLDVPVQKLVDRLDDPRYYVYTPVPVAFDVSKTTAFSILEHSWLFPGVDVEQLPVRTYPKRNMAAQTLGYTGEISEDQLKSPEFADYRQGLIVGQNGVEQTYERYLQGRQGEHKYKVNSTGKNLGGIGNGRPSVPGDDVLLSIDSKIQYMAQRSLVLGEKQARSIADEDTGRPLAADAGAVVVMDPNNGQVLAMASSPTYDPRIFVGGVTQDQYKSLSDPARNNPLFDRAIQGEYPAGSTFKPFVALSALRRGIASPYRSYHCPSVYHVPGDPNTVFYNWSTSDGGYISLAQALVVSCDTVFYDLGWNYWLQYAHSGAGPENSSLNEYQGRKIWLQDDLRTFGFDRPTGVDLPFEQDGRIPDPAWKERIHRQYPELFPYGLWLPGDFINMSIGQGDSLVTPLQLAVAYSAIANGGTVWVPHTALEVRRPEGRLVKRIKPRKAGKLPFSAADLAYVRQALTQVPVSGTAETAFVQFPLYRIPVAGKTGTAEVNPHQPYSWFAAMAPADHPQYVVVAIVEQGGHGATTAAPIVRRILEGLFGLPQTPFSLGFFGSRAD